MQSIGIPRLYRNSTYVWEELEKGCEMLKCGVFFDFSLRIISIGYFVFDGNLVQRRLIGHEHFLVAAECTTFFKKSAFSYVIHIHQ